MPSYAATLASIAEAHLPAATAANLAAFSLTSDMPPIM
eukprot:CAMPEP_0171256516 /NCGR_PEP_ID=MMETSP0790-20130122/53347_1 /TAXON_ID=2925 /ORGANISM="Alexandrium catenella, Strain OF101" /LENGTH=37 /DNA_ID= /DNA_START= /DNA_END= /DNA_ORIENTATION=